MSERAPLLLLTTGTETNTADLVLAEVGSTRTWTEIATQLDLQPAIATIVGAVSHRIHQRGC